MKGNPVLNLRPRISGSGQARIAILLTATVNPAGMPGVARSDSRTRLQDYVRAFTRWIDRTSYPLVFCENSGADLSPIKRLAGRRKDREVEILGFEGNDFPRSLGKGYGEMNILKFLLRQSTLLADCDFAVKVTGRCFVRNIHQLAGPLEANPNIGVMAGFKKEHRARSQIFAFRPSFLRDYFLPLQKDVNEAEKVYFEHVLARAIGLAREDGLGWSDFPEDPVLEGHSGTTNRPYPLEGKRRENSLKDRLKWFSRGRKPEKILQDSGKSGFKP